MHGARTQPAALSHLRLAGSRASTTATQQLHLSNAAEPDVRRGVRLGVDPGQARIGVARSDPDGVLATPVETVQRGYGDVTRIWQIAADIADETGSEILEVVTGLPRSLNGLEGPSAKKARRFARALARKMDPTPVRLVDERLTTVTAEAVLRDQGHYGQQRRNVVDQAAAVVILQHALDSERASGRPPGEIVEETS